MDERFKRDMKQAMMERLRCIQRCFDTMMFTGRGNLGEGLEQCEDSCPGVTFTMRNQQAADKLGEQFDALTRQVAYARGVGMVYVDDRWLEEFARCTLSQGARGHTYAGIVEMCKRKGGASAAVSDGGEATADSGEELVGSNSDADHITPAPANNAYLQTRQFDARARRTPFLARIAEFTEAMAPNFPERTPEKVGEWYVEPAAPLPNGGVWFSSGKKTRKVAMREAQRMANKTGIPWRIVRWFADPPGATAWLDRPQVIEDLSRPESHDPEHPWLEIDRRGYAWYLTYDDAKQEAKFSLSVQDGRARISRTFFPAGGSADGINT